MNPGANEGTVVGCRVEEERYFPYVHRIATVRLGSGSEEVEVRLGRDESWPAIGSMVTVTVGFNG